MSESLKRFPSPASAVFPVRSGNLIEPLVDGAMAFDRIASAVEAATASVWVCVAFLEVEVQFPGRRGTFLDLMDAAVDRGVDVRVLVWHPLGHGAGADDTFPGNQDTTSLLGGRDTRWHARWDAVGQNCQHQKVWLIDAETSGAVAFVGGINITRGSMANRSHESPDPSLGFIRGERYSNIHDVHCLLQGPCVADVHDNFVMRWNCASERDRAFGSWPAGWTVDLEERDLDKVPAEVGSATGQIQRSVLPGLYDRLPDGENSVREQYLLAIASAVGYIYIEDQILLSRVVLAALREALERGVLVVASVPGDPMPELAAAQAHPGIAAGYEALADLGEFDGFCLSAPAVRRAWGVEEIYVHAKTAVVDDFWATIGSTNLVFSSFQGDTEMNLSFWNEDVARSLRVQQVDEQGGFDSSGIDGRTAVARLIEVARINAAMREAGETWTGFACAIDPASWAL
ncbi:MAG: phosphatidylserine/phosphatidylglycerophosphate/cardiolipin synthase family protein [Acidimicrobiales bacterium]|nr:phosphatidylserine/phosphatidylglycerophosphate/cardiolipin synthase family protein [Acidimicrobiales bacterium]